MEMAQSYHRQVQADVDDALKKRKKGKTTETKVDVKSIGDNGTRA